MVNGTAFVLVFLLLIGSVPVLGKGDDWKIMDAYSIGDRIAFVVLNETSEELYTVVYNGHFFEAEQLNFTLKRYQVRHWNGEYWLLQKGEMGTVELYTYRKGRLRLIKTFEGGSLCTDNDLDINKWNGREYSLTFLGADPRDDPMRVECMFRFKDYLLREDKLIPLNVTGQGIWIPELNAWLIGESLVDENGRVLERYNFSKTGIYSVGVVVDNGRTLIVVSSDGGWIRIFAIKNSSLVLTYHRRFEKRELGEGPYPPDVWIGKPVLFDRDPRNTSISVVWLFNGTDFIKIHTFKDYAMLYSVTTSDKSYILSRVPTNMGTHILLNFNLFELRGFSLVKVGSLKVKYVYFTVIDMNESKGFPAPKVEPRSMLVASGENSVFLFNSSHIFDFLSGDSFELPDALKNGYKVALCCGGWIVFNENRAYFFKNGKFSDITPKILSALSKSPESNSNLTTVISPESNGYLTAVIFGGLAVVIAILLVFLRKRV